MFVAHVCRLLRQKAQATVGTYGNAYALIHVCDISKQLEVRDEVAFGVATHSDVDRIRFARGGLGRGEQQSAKPTFGD